MTTAIEIPSTMHPWNVVYALAEVAQTPLRRLQHGECRRFFTSNSMRLFQNKLAMSSAYGAVLLITRCA